MRILRLRPRPCLSRGSRPEKSEAQAEFLKRQARNVTVKSEQEDIKPIIPTDDNSSRDDISASIAIPVATTKRKAASEMADTPTSPTSKSGSTPMSPSLPSAVPPTTSAPSSKQSQISLSTPQTSPVSKPGSTAMPPPLPSATLPADPAPSMIDLNIGVKTQVEGTQQVGSQPLTVNNPFASLFGPANGPSARIESLEVVLKKGSTKKAGASLVKDGTKKEGKTLLKTYAPGMKKVMGSSSEKNLYYMDYLQNNDPITPSAFKIHWKTLSKEEQKKYTEWSKRQKEELGDLVQD
ncbi:hypothetical protein BYT27DRAFT_7208145 [Phlegmacium glaucopus]|nr:hypothetical protein BYT27DRAFT_7208145 [Phlegmacium glaucopus]